MTRRLSVVVFLIVVIAALPAAAQTEVFIDETRYGNTGTDAGEEIEIAVPAQAQEEKDSTEFLKASVYNVIPIQGRLTTASGVPLDGDYIVWARLYDDYLGTTLLCEDDDHVTIDNGLFEMEMDYCTPVDIDGKRLYLGIEVESDGEMTPRLPIYPTPYAFSLRPAAIIKGDTSVAIVHIENEHPSGRGLRSYAMDETGINYGVIGASRSPAGYGGYFYNNGGGVALFAKTSGAGNDMPALSLVNEDATGDFVVGAESGGGTRNFRIDRTGRGFFNGGYQASGADFAERLDLVGENTEPGDVLVISSTADRAVELAATSFSSAVIGIHSTAPALLGGAPDNDEPLGGIPVAITGIVPCKVTTENGAISRGDLLVTSSVPGHAMRAGSSPPAGTVLGKAMQPLDQGTGVIEIYVSAR
jgi:hypothetical protein